MKLVSTSLGLDAKIVVLLLIALEVAEKSWQGSSRGPNNFMINLQDGIAFKINEKFATISRLDRDTVFCNGILCWSTDLSFE